MVPSRRAFSSAAERLPFPSASKWSKMVFAASMRDYPSMLGGAPASYVEAMNTFPALESPNKAATARLVIDFIVSCLSMFKNVLLSQ